MCACVMGEMITCLLNLTKACGALWMKEHPSLHINYRWQHSSLTLPAKNDIGAKNSVMCMLKMEIIEIIKWQSPSTYSL